MTITCDVLVIGGGVVGLWVAKFASRAGLKVILADKEACGAGGSGGVLGALLPHLPNAMNEKNRFQFDALVDLPGLVAGLEEEGGQSAGYAQCGRLMPIRHEGFEKTIELCISKSKENWLTDGKAFSFERIEGDRFADWLDPEKAPMGLGIDNLAAKIHPESYINALKASMNELVEIREGVEIVHVDHRAGEAKTRDGDVISAGQIVLTAGYQSYDLLETVTGISFGGGVKGQAALFEMDLPEQQPVIYDDGMYIVHHAPGYCAVGSTTEPDWKDAKSHDPRKTEKFLNKARGVCPKLRDEEPVAYWAGIRPKSHAKDPMAGPLTPDSRLYIATGGFKISFGIAHRLADYTIRELINGDKRISLPHSYTIEHHVRCGVDMGRISENDLRELTGFDPGQVSHV